MGMDLGLAGRFSKSLFIKTGMGYGVIASVSTGATFDWKDSIKASMSALSLCTARAAELLVQAETMRQGPYGPVQIIVKVFRDTRYPDLLVHGYPEALGTVFINPVNRSERYLSKLI